MSSLKSSVISRRFPQVLAFPDSIVAAWWKPTLTNQWLVVNTSAPEILGVAMGQNWAPKKSEFSWLGGKTPKSTICLSFCGKQSCYGIPFLLDSSRKLNHRCISNAPRERRLYSACGNCWVTEVNTINTIGGQLIGLI